MTYAELIDNIAEWLNRRNGELDNIIAQQIIESQAALEKKLPLWFLVDEFVSDIPAYSNSTVLPWHIIRIYDAEIRDSDNIKYEIGVTSHATMRDEHPFDVADTPETGRPRMLTIMGHTIRYAPQSDAAYTLRLKAHHHLAELHLVTNKSNEWTTNSPYLRALRYDVLIGMEAFIKDDERLMIWKAQRDEILEDLQAEVTRQEITGMREMITEDLY
jgi:hypothetical protein